MGGLEFMCVSLIQTNKQKKAWNQLQMSDMTFLKAYVQVAIVMHK